ncbi:Sialic acid TRAP transporter large permease protein SiaM [Dissostichus eleginoides]|uniref:Sialic acid TRAP transporter large permease protein SiaM n=1 Tax=Dissostichus eleginoides TaxID=100907 RepID=A0AAD9BPX7_DISEL|nr:Sialic acid TRAP transporter large permease protein SiaM [Dissostichus eleginoides]
MVLTRSDFWSLGLANDMDGMILNSCLTVIDKENAANLQSLLLPVGTWTLDTLCLKKRGRKTARGDGRKRQSREFNNDSEYHQDDSGGLDADSCVSPGSLDEKKKAPSSTTEAHEPEEIELNSVHEYENVSHTAAETEDTEEQEDMV